MALSFFTKQKQDESLVLLVDIGSASVGGALVKIEKGSAPHILVTVRESFEDHANKDEPCWFESSHKAYWFACAYFLHTFIAMVHFKEPAFAYCAPRGIRGH